MQSANEAERPGAVRAFFDLIAEAFVSGLPQDPLSMRIKSLAMRARGARVGKRVKIWRRVWIDDFRRVTFGDEVTVGHGAMFVCGGGGNVAVGDRVMIAHGAQIISSGHRIPDDPAQAMRWSGPESDPVSIENDAWIGAGAIVLPGVTVAQGAIVGAGSVVTADVPANAVVVGNPARVIRTRS
jgi:acetyltransferase-like isoleucine patch superfamily enzyme